MTETTISSMAIFALLAPASFLITALVAVKQNGIKPKLVQKFGNLAGLVGMVASIAAAIYVAINDSVQTSTIGIRELGFSIRLDSLSVIMLVMISILAYIIFRYSCTYLEGDRRHGSFLGYLALTIAAVEVLVLSGNLGILVISWVGTSLALHKLLLFYKERPRAVNAARKKFIVARLGDLSLIGAVVLLFNQFNTGDLSSIFDQAKDINLENPGWAPTSLDFAALLLVGAALLKAAQFPTHGWLVEVMETPTPVSALLHAGILNAGPFLAIRMAFVLDASRTATTVLILVGGFTAAFASICLLTQPSVKVMLGYSSAAHMGFMLMVCGLGLYPAALLHLVAHSFYKAHAFLSSGSVVDDYRAHGVVLPKRLGNPIRILTSALIAIAWYIPLAWVWSSVLETSASTIAIGAIFVLGMTQLIAPALDSNGPVQGTFRASLLALAVTTSFFTLEATMHELLYSIIPEPINRDLFQLASFGLILAIFTVVVWMQIMGAVAQQTPKRRKLAIIFKNGFYANAYFDRMVGSLKTKQSRNRMEAAQ